MKIERLKSKQNIVYAVFPTHARWSPESHRVDLTTNGTRSNDIRECQVT